MKDMTASVTTPASVSNTRNRSQTIDIRAAQHKSGWRPQPLVAICIATCQRPIYLHKLLTSIQGAEIEGFGAYLIVVDNDPAGGARPVVEEFEGNFGFPVKYVIEPERGIASARNRLVLEAAQMDADYIAFVDDDVVVESNWLRELVRVAQLTNADAVAGACIVTFEDGAPDWIAKAKLSFQPERRATGTPLRLGSTANVLIKLTSINQIPGPFDSRLNLLGGSDLLLFEQFHQRGFASIWCDESIVHETYPVSRASASWIIKRHYRIGVGIARTSTWIDPQPKKIISRAAKSCASISKNSLLLLPASLDGKPKVLRHIARISFGMGTLAGLVGQGDGYAEYRNIHGR